MMGGSFGGNMDGLDGSQLSLDDVGWELVCAAAAALNSASVAEMVKKKRFCNRTLGISSCFLVEMDKKDPSADSLGKW